MVDRENVPALKCPGTSECCKILRTQWEKVGGNLVKHLCIKDKNHSGRKTFFIILLAGGRNWEGLRTASVVMFCFVFSFICASFMREYI